MINFQSEITNYLSSHDLVLLPGIGGFLADYTKPYIDANGEIVPPLRSIRFNSFLSEDSDVQFLKYIQNKNGTSVLETQTAYFNFLDLFEEKLLQYNQFPIENFGILTRENPTKELIFIPFKNNFLTQTINNTVSTETNLVDESFETENLIDSKENNSPFQTSKESTSEQIIIKQEVSKENRFLKYFIFIIPLLLLATALFYSIFIKPVSQKTVKALEPVEEPVKITEPSQQVVVDTLEIETPKQEKVEEIKEHIVRIGIYKTTEDADKVAVFLAEHGYPARVRPYGTLFKVYLVALSERQAHEYVEKVPEIINDTPVYEK